MNLKAFKDKWKRHYAVCYDYCRTWFIGRWSNWQFYHNLPGQANTNSNNESFMIFTFLTKFNILCVITLFMCYKSYVWRFFFYVLGCYSCVIKNVTLFLMGDSL